MDFSRYSRQMALPHMGEQAQQRLANSRVIIVGCGALGTVSADLLARAGIGEITIVDRDIVELTNLQRQTLFDEEDARKRQPKALAAAEKLKLVNSSIKITGLAVDFRWDNAVDLVTGQDLVIDATDNYLTRLTINDACLEAGIPFVYGGAVGYIGMTLNIVPGGMCYRCMMSDLPSPGVGDSCDVAGILAPVTVIIAANQVAEAIKLLAMPQYARKGLLEIDLLAGQYRTLELARDPECPACQKGQRDFLSAEFHQDAAVVCGRHSVMLQWGNRENLDLKTVGDRLVSRGLNVNASRFRLQLMVDDIEIILFSDGRALVNGTNDPATAKRLYASYFGG